MDGVTRKYDEYSEEYHKSRLAGRFFNEYVDMPAIFSLLGDVKGRKILDAGCGSGIYAKRLKEMGADVTGIDISKKMVEIAKKYAKGVDFFVMDASKTTFRDNTFDIVCSPSVIDNIGDISGVFREALRIINPGGYMVFSTFHLHLA